MAESEPPPPKPLQFDVAEPASGAAAAPAAPACAFCARPIEREYYTIAARPCCGPCREAALAEQNGPARPGRFVKALALGSAAAALGCGIYYAVLALTGYEVGLVAIVVGFLVGTAVRRGSGARGGWVYQTLAVGLTYLAIVCTYVPFIIEGIRSAPVPGETRPAPRDSDGLGAPAPPPEGAAPAGVEEAPPPSTAGLLIGLALLVLLACAAPFLGGAGNLLGLLIIGFALWEAWKLNRAVKLDFAGPFQASPHG